jgi:hypothetical protein
MKSMLLESGSRIRSEVSFMMNLAGDAVFEAIVLPFRGVLAKVGWNGFKTSYISETKVGDKRSTMQGF